MIPRSQQVYKILHIAISILEDLGLNETPNLFSKQHSDVYLTDSSIRANEDTVMTMRAEASRASLGCFYLSGV